MANVEIKFGQVYELEIAKIEIPWDWNVRSGNWKQGSADETENDFDGLVHSLEVEGQKTPVQVMPNPDTKSKKPFVLVTGFRRMAAMIKLKSATIKAIVLAMNPIEARLNNLLENTSRSDLKGADLAFGLVDLEKTYHQMGKPWVQSQVAQALGINQGYCNMLCKIMKAVKPELTAAWRESPVVVPIQSMNKLAEVKPDEQPEAFKKLLENQAGKADGRSKKGKEQKLIESAEKVGKLLGALVREDYIQVSGGLEVSDKDFWKIMGVSIPDEFEDVPAVMIKMANQAFNEAIEVKEPPAKKSGAKNSKATAAA